MNASPRVYATIAVPGHATKEVMIGIPQPLGSDGYLYDTTHANEINAVECPTFRRYGMRISESIGHVLQETLW